MQNDPNQAEIKPQDGNSTAAAWGGQVPRLGNRSLLGKVPVKCVDWTILVVSVALICIFVLLLVSRH